MKEQTLNSAKEPTVTYRSALRQLETTPLKNESHTPFYMTNSVG